jgi:small subunit ribosomal protein S19e
MILNATARFRVVMTTLYDVPAEELVAALADRLADDLEEPEWVGLATTGTDRELPPEQEDFWTTRGASILRKIAVDGPVGVDRLRTAYGGPKQGSTRYRVRPNRHADAGGSVIRTLVQQLEAAGYVDQEGNAGRVVTGEGRALLDETAGDVLEELDRPELERYA